MVSRSVMLSVIHAGRRLVQQQNVWLDASARSDLQQALLRVRHCVA